MNIRGMGNSAGQLRSVKGAFSPVARALLVGSLCLIAARAAAFPTASYFPLPDGATWTYSVSDGTTVSTVVTTVVGSATLNGAVVKVLRNQAGFEDYFTNDAAGVRFHGAVYVDPFYGPVAETYLPPVPFAAREASIGTPVTCPCSVTTEVYGVPRNVGYDSVSTPLGFETVVVPAGTFTDALHVQVTAEINGGFDYDTFDLWLVAGIGLVKKTWVNWVAPYNAMTSELVSYRRRPLGDFNGDGRSDVLWRNSSTGESYFYPMNGTAILATEGYLRTVAELNWRIAGRGDFDGDGKADILWRNSSTGENYVYFMNVLSIVNEGYLRTVPDQNWQVAGIGDFDGDGKSDILWRNSSTGENYVYFMNGLLIVNEGNPRTVADTSWQVAGVGDFNGDGRADILWRNGASGENYVYLMNGTTIAGEGYLRTVAELAWQVKGVGDFDGDGKTDIAWRNNATGENYLYLMSGTGIVGEGYVRTADTVWQIAAVGDYDGDGKSDLFWRNASTGENYIYPMDGLGIKPSEGYLRTVGDQNWKPQR